MTAVGGFVLLLFGVWLFTQGTLGDLTKRLLSFAGGDEPERTSPTSLEVRPLSTKQRRRALHVPVGIPRGPGFVYDVLAVACHQAGGDFECISWSRPGAVVRGDPNNPSCHGAKDTRTRKVGLAMDIRPKKHKGKVDWARCDHLVVVLNKLRNTPINGHRVGEVVFRGDSDHDPALGADAPHVHAAVDCG